MKKTLQILAVLTLLVWGGLFLYFYGSGRIEKYLAPNFRIYALLSGIGFLLLGAFNFLNRNRAVGLCTHDHAHGDACDHDHHHHAHGSPSHQAKGHGGGACGHDHGHDHVPDHGPGHHHDHDHDHEQDPHHAHGEPSGHGGSCGHGEAPSHSHASHDHGPGCRGHDHDHVHDHDHGCCGHDHASPHDHAHAHSHEDSPAGVAFSLLVLILPLLVATAYSHVKFSAGYLAKWDKIERQMMQKRIADARGSAPAPTATAAESGNAVGTGATGENPDAPKGTADAAKGEAWGSFTLEDLKKMVPQNDKGEFLLDVPQIFYTAGDKELMAVMEGIPVETTAQLMEENLHNPDKTRLKAFRVFIECCAADARPLSIPVDFGKAPPEYQEMGWYKLVGKLHYSQEGEEIIPLLKVEQIEATAEPSDGLLF